MNIASSGVVFLGLGAALISALLFGVADFTTGELSKKASAFIFTGGVYIAEVPFLFLVYVASRDYGTATTNIGLFFAGSMGAFGFLAVVYGMAKGSTSVVMSLSGLIGIVLPAIASVVIGEKSSILIWLGVLVAMIAITCVTQVRKPHDETQHEEHRKLVKLSVLAGSLSGIGVGIYFIGLDQFDAPVATRLFYLQLFGFVCAVIYFSFKPEYIKIILRKWHVLLGLGLAYQIAQVMYPFASDRTSLIVTNIIVSLYPAVAIGLEKIINHEKTNNIQHLGFVFAALGVVLVSIGAGS